MSPVSQPDWLGLRDLASPQKNKVRTRHEKPGKSCDFPGLESHGMLVWVMKSRGK